LVLSLQRRGLLQTKRLPLRRYWPVQRQTRGWKLRRWNQRKRQLGQRLVQQLGLSWLLRY
jgi:hypothetical protein